MIPANNHRASVHRCYYLLFSGRRQVASFFSPNVFCVIPLISILTLSYNVDGRMGWMGGWMGLGIPRAGCFCRAQITIKVSGWLAGLVNIRTQEKKKHCRLYIPSMMIWVGLILICLYSFLSFFFFFLIPTVGSFWFLSRCSEASEQLTLPTLSTLPYLSLA